jgi:hypothetical protein
MIPDKDEGQEENLIDMGKSAFEMVDKKEEEPVVVEEQKQPYENAISEHVEEQAVHEEKADSVNSEKHDNAVVEE